MTAKEKVFVDVYARTNDHTLAAKEAGYASYVHRGSELASKPALIAEVRKIQSSRLFSEALPIAVNTLVSIMQDPGAPAGSRVQASKVVLDRTLGTGEGGTAKEPHEMTAEEIAEAINKLEGIASARAKPVENAESAQPVRKEASIFE